MSGTAISSAATARLPSTVAAADYAPVGTGGGPGKILLHFLHDGSFSAKAYGAVGDGSTDDTAAVQAAIDAAEAVGAPAYLPPGNYRLTSTITFGTAYGKLFGAGMYLSTLLAPLSTANAVTVAAADITLEDLGIDGRYTSQSNSGGESNQCGVYLSASADRCAVRRCYIRNTCGNGVSNAVGFADLTVDDCVINNLGTFASEVQATPAPTTTTFAVAPGTSANLSAGMPLKVGSQTATVQSVQTARSYVAAVTSTSVFTLNAGGGASFSNGNVIRVGPYSGTIQSISTDTITLTGALAAAPVVGQIVAIDNVTLTGAVTLPVAGDVVRANYPTLKGVYCRGSAAARPRVTRCRMSGWSQAVGFWYGANDGLIADNMLVNNYGAESDGVLYRSAIEVYANTARGSRHRILGNLVDGATLNCLEVPDGEAGVICEGNTLSNWGAEVGLSASTGVAAAFAGAATPPAQCHDCIFSNNYVLSNGANASNGVRVSHYTYGVKVVGNSFFGFSGNGSSYPVSLIGSPADAPTVALNTFNRCYRGVYVNSSGLKGGIIQGNKFLNFPTGASGRFIEFAVAGDGWVISGNAMDETSLTSGMAGLLLSSGNRHTIIGNKLACGSPLQMSGVNDCTVVGNVILKNTNDGAGAVRVLGASARNVFRDNSISNPARADRVFEIGGTADYNEVSGNRFISSGAAVYIPSTGTHNWVGGNGDNAVLRPSADVILSGKTVNSTQTTIAHGLGYTPTVVYTQITATGTWVRRTAASDATNVYLTADVDSTTCDVFVR